MNKQEKTRELANSQIQLDFSKTTAEVCEKCENDTFTQIYKMRKLSKLLSPTGEETMIPIQVF